MLTDAEIRRHLADLRDQLKGRDALIFAGARAGIPKTELAELTGLNRSYIYDILDKQEKLTKEAELAAHAAAAPQWKLGQVIEDRYGLRWRGDVNGRTGERAWVCRSVGLRIWRSGAEMGARHPLKEIRLDKVFAGPEATAARKAGDAEDAAVVVEPVEDPEDEQVTA